MVQHASGKKDGIFDFPTNIFPHQPTNLNGNFFFKLNKIWNPCRRSCEPMYISKIKSECGIAQLSLPFFPAAAYVHLVELININDLLDDTTSLLSTNQRTWFCLGRSAGRSVGLPEIEMFGGRSNDLKTLLSFVLSISKLPTGEGLKQHAQILF